MKKNINLKIVIIFFVLGLILIIGLGMSLSLIHISCDNMNNEKIVRSMNLAKAKVEAEAMYIGCLL